MVNDGVLLNLKLKLPNNTEPGDYVGQITNIELTTASKPLAPSDCSITLSVINAKIGDVDGNGRVSIFDAVQVVNYILGNNPVDFVESAADVDGHGRISIFDAVSIVNIILNQNANGTRRKSRDIIDILDEIEPQ